MKSGGFFSCWIGVWGVMGFPLLAIAKPSYRVLEAPCIQAAGMGEYKKAKVSGKHAGERICKEVLKEAVTRLEERVRQQADHFYEGCDLGGAGLSTSGQGGCPGTSVPRETCNVLDQAGVPKTFNQGQVEREQNHLGKKCGDWPYFAARKEGRVCHITPNYTRTTHFIEDSFNRGAWIQALNCYHQQVRGEVEKGQLKLTRVMGAGGREVDGLCLTMAEDYEKTRKTSDQVLSSLEKSLGAQLNLEDIENCEQTPKTVTTEENPDQGKNRQSACQLVSIRRSLETMFVHLAACEVWQRAGRSYERFLGQSVGTDTMKLAARRAIDGIKSKNRNSCKTSYVLNNYYIPRYMNIFRSRANSIWNAGTCGPIAEGEGR